MALELNEIDPEKVRIQLESAVSSHEMTVAGLLIDKQITEEAIASLADGESNDTHYHSSLAQIQRDLDFYTNKHSIAKRKLEEFNALG